MIVLDVMHIMKIIIHLKQVTGFVMDGHTKVTIDSSVYDVHGGDIIVVFPNQIHQFETVEHENYILLIIDPEIIPELTSVFTLSLPISNLIKGGAEDEELLNLITRISDVYRSDQLYKDPILHGYILAFFGKLLQNCVGGCTLPLQYFGAELDQICGGHRFIFPDNLCETGLNCTQL